MRRPPALATLSGVTKQRVILEADIEGSAILGTLTAATGEGREFHGWLELNTALEAILNLGADPARSVTTDEE
jgi:hypothetical protein